MSDFDAMVKALVKCWQERGELPELDSSLDVVMGDEGDRGFTRFTVSNEALDAAREHIAGDLRADLRRAGYELKCSDLKGGEHWYDHDFERSIFMTLDCWEPSLYGWHGDWDHHDEATHYAGSVEAIDAALDKPDA